MGAQPIWNSTIHDPTALYTLVLAFFTFVLAGASVWQGWLTRKTITLAREEFASAHRPHLIVRRISLDRFGVGQIAEIQFIVANVGDTPGTIIESNATIQIYRDGGRAPQIPLYSDDTASMGTPSIKPGPGLPIKVTSNFLITEELYKAVYPDAGFISGALYLIGYIVYAGADGVHRHYTFGRRFDPARHRFAIMDDPNYEYGGV